MPHVLSSLSYFMKMGDPTSTHSAAIFDELPEWARRAWARLIEMVQEFEPDVVVLTARKMPRICEGLQMHFGDQVLVISDLAIPFSSGYLAGARVAIVDDVVNFGSTLEQVAGIVERHSPAVVKLFSLARRTPAVPNSKRDISYAHPVVLGEENYAGYVRTVPAAISHVCKPYDLAFPILRGQYRIPFCSSAEIVESLKSEFDNQVLRIIPSPYANSPIRRVSLLLFEENCELPPKFRLYFDDLAQVCSVVPMVVPHHVAEASMPVTLSWVATIRKELKNCLELQTDVDAADTLAAVVLFTSALDWFWSGDANANVHPYFDFGNTPFSIADAKFIFGPKVDTILAGISPKTFSEPPQGNGLTRVQSVIKSPFLEKFDVDQLVATAVRRLNQNGILSIPSGADSYSYLLAIVEALAELVATQNPCEYKLTWPYSREQIVENPYLRLRIGPTFPDIVTICRLIHRRITNSELLPPDFVNALSITLDALIDQGAVVPTFANYDGNTFRIYRRGEAPGQDVCDTVIYAAAAYNKPVSVTRLAKILATLSHSQKYHSILESSARTRGLVGGVPKSALGAEPDNIATYLRNTGQIRPVEG